MKTAHGGDWAGYREEYAFLPLDFSASVSPLGMPKVAREAAVQALDAAERYPDPLCRELRSRLSALHGLPTEHIVCGNGAAELIFRLCRCLQPRQALLTAPDFGEYSRALTSVGCEVRRVYRLPEENFRLNKRFPEELLPGTELLFLSNPNNPSGVLCSRDELERILAACRNIGCILVLDECFLDFCQESERFSPLDAAAEWPELVILRAFTKTWGMAGLRLGYALCGNQSLAKRLEEEGPPWSVSQPAQAAGAAALEDREYPKSLRRLLARERPRMQEGLASLGFRVVKGEANFLLFQSEDLLLCGKLRKKGILIRDCGNFPGLRPGWYRTAIRTEQENNALLSALREVLENG